ncbi:MAG: hypothetical protein PHY47_22715 [Lachnospiraceae bacterium]|nr:hypothetical protein [Lachnospiraceae bacterium]
MKISKKSIPNVLFFELPMFMLGLNYILYNALGVDSLKTIIRVVSIILIVIGYLLSNDYILTKKEFFAVGLAFIMVLINGTTSLNLLVAIVFAICVCQPVNEVLNSAKRINIALTVLMGVLLVFHVVSNTGYVSTMGRLRFTLGFENPNVASLFYSSAIILFIVAQKKRKIIKIFLGLILSIILYVYTDSRTSFLAIVLLCVLEVVFYVCDKRNNINGRRVFGKIALIVVDSLFTINLLSVFFIERFMVLDELLSFRISTFSKMIVNSGLRCFLFGGTTNTVDNFYYMLLFQYGIFVYLFVAIMTHVALNKCIKSEQDSLVSLLFTMFLVGVMESSIIRPEILVSLMVWKIVISNKNMELKSPYRCEEKINVKE